MSEEKFDFGSMVSAQMKTFRPGFKFPGSFNDLKSVESDPGKRRAAIEAAADGAEESAVEEKNPPSRRRIRSTSPSRRHSSPAILLKAPSRRK